MRLPNQEQLKYYWAVSLGDSELPCALFTLKSDAEDWVKRQDTRDLYEVVPPSAP